MLVDKTLHSRVDIPDLIANVGLACVGQVGPSVLFLVVFSHEKMPKTVKNGQNNKT